MVAESYKVRRYEYITKPERKIKLLHSGLVINKQFIMFQKDYSNTSSHMSWSFDDGVTSSPASPLNTRLSL